jgi:hypothetical protein
MRYTLGALGGFSMSATVTARPPSAPATIVARDRLFYSGMAIAMAVTVFAGFLPTYYLRLLGDGPTTTINGLAFTPMVRLHAVIFSGWVLLFVAQTTFIASHRVKLHQRAGIAGGVFAAAMVVVGMATATEATARGSAPPGIDPLSFFAIPFFDMTLFAVFITTALWNRRIKDAHKRLMLLAYISTLTAAVARLPGVLPLGPFGFYGLTFVFLVVAIAYDYLSRRHVHRVYIWGGALLVMSVPGRLVLSETAGWKAFAAFVTR